MIVSLQLVFVSMQRSGLGVFIATLTTLAIVLLDLITSKSINLFVSFEKHFSSVGRNWKRVSYFAIFIVLNSVACILAYSFSQPILDTTGYYNTQAVEQYQNETYIRSYHRWLESCSRSPYRSPRDIITEISKKIDEKETQMTIGYWSHFTSQYIDGHISPAFAYSQFIDPRFGVWIHQVGCNSKNRLFCDNSVEKLDISIFPMSKYSQYSDSCAFISNLSYVAEGPIPKILFSAAMYDFPWSSNKSEFRLRSFAEEGSLYGFLFAFIIFKAIRLAFYYLYNDFVSIISHRLFSPLLKRLGYNPNVR